MSKYRNSRGHGTIIEIRFDPMTDDAALTSSASTTNMPQVLTSTYVLTAEYLRIYVAMYMYVSGNHHHGSCIIPEQIAVITVILLVMIRCL